MQNKEKKKFSFQFYDSALVYFTKGLLSAQVLMYFEIKKAHWTDKINEYMKLGIKYV